MAATGKANTPPGPATDASGQSVVDPTRNVLDLVHAAIQRVDDMLAAAVKRMDDLRMADEKRIDDLLASKAAEHERLDAMLNTKIEYIEKMNGQRDLHAIELREAESARIDAIREVDVNAVGRAHEVAATAATTLATQVATQAEALRAQQDALAKAGSTALQTELVPMRSAIEELRRMQYELQGQRQPNPNQEALVNAIAPIQTAIDDLRKTQAENLGQKAQVVESRDKGMSAGVWIGLAVAAAGLAMTFILSVAGIAITLLLRSP